MSAPTTDLPAGTFTPAPGRAPLARMVRAQAAMELRLMLRNGEQLLLLVVIPVLLLVGFTTVHAVALPGRRIDFMVPGVFAVAVLSTAFTGQAIGTGFDRGYGVLKQLGATPLPRAALLAAKALAVLAVEVAQVAVLSAVGLALGWHPHGDPLLVAALLVLATATFAGIGLLMAGTLPARATLAAANLVYLLLLGSGGLVYPLDDLPAGARGLADLSPAATLADALRDVLRDGGTGPARCWIALACWGAVALAAAARWFRWE
ncbi:MAG: ABC transporter permease [Mycobacteriales bacterium]